MWQNHYWYQSRCRSDPLLLGVATRVDGDHSLTPAGQTTGWGNAAKHQQMCESSGQGADEVTVRGTAEVPGTAAAPWRAHCNRKQTLFEAMVVLRGNGRSLAAWKFRCNQRLPFVRIKRFILD